MEGSRIESKENKRCEQCQKRSSTLKTIKFMRIVLHDSKCCLTKESETICTDCDTHLNKDRFEICYICNNLFEGQLEQAKYGDSHISLCLLCYKGNVCEKCADYCGNTECDDCKSVYDYY